MSRRRGVVVVLLIVMCLATVVWCGFIAPEIRRYHRWEDAGSNIVNNGGMIMKDGAVLMSEQRSFGDRQLSAIIPSLPLVQFNSLDLHGTSVTDGGMARLAAVNELQSLDVSDTPVTVNGLLALQRLPSLSAISVSPGQLSESDMKRLYSALRKQKVPFGVYIRSQRQIDPSTTSPDTSPSSSPDQR